MAETAEEAPRCGFGLADGSMCFAQVKGEGPFCLDHAALHCGGCRRNEATHECRHGDGVFLCEACGHISGTQHGTPPDSRSSVRSELESAARMILDQLSAEEVLPSTRPQREQAAPMIIEYLTLHITMKVLAGLARTPGTQSERGAG